MAEWLRVLLPFVGLLRWPCPAAVEAGSVSSNNSDVTLYVGLLAPIAPNGNWHLPTARNGCDLAVKHINNNPELLKGYRLELKFGDDACSAVKGNTAMLRILEDQNKRVVTLLGAGCSTVTQPVSQSSWHWNLLVFNYISTSPALQDCKKYPYFYTIQPSEYSLIPARVQLMKDYGWSKVVIFHQPIGVWSVAAERLQQLFQKENFEVEVLAVSAETDMQAAVKHAVATKIRIYFLLSYESTAKRLICEAYKGGIRSTTHTWIYVGGINDAEWYLNDINDSGCDKHQLRKAFDGHFSLDFAHVGANESARLWTNKTVGQVADEIKQLDPNRRNDSFRKTFEGHWGYGYDVVVTVAKMLQEYIDSNPELFLEHFNYNDTSVPKKLNSILRSRSFDVQGITGIIRFYDRYCNESNINWGHVIARYNRGSKSEFVWEYDQGWSEQLEEPDWPGGGRPSDFPERRLISPVTFGVITALACLGILFATCFLVYSIINRNFRIFRLSGPRLNAVLAIGSMGGYLAVILDGLNGQFFDLELWSCFAKVCLLAACFSCTFGVVLGQMWRLSLGVKKRETTKPRKRRISNVRIDLTEQNLLVIVGLFLIVDIVIVIIWFTVDPWTVGTRPLESGQIVNFEQQKCSCDNFLVWVYVFAAYKGLLLTFGVYLAFDIRQIKVRFVGDSRFMAVAVYTSAAICIMLLIFLHVDVADPDVYYALTSVMLLVVITVLLLLMFLPKIYALKFRPNKTVGGIGPARGIEKGSMSEHTIASSQDINMLRKRNTYQREIIQMLIDERHISEETVHRVTEELDLDVVQETEIDSHYESTSTRERVFSEESSEFSSDKRAAADSRKSRDSIPAEESRGHVAILDSTSGTVPSVLTDYHSKFKETAL